MKQSNRQILIEKVFNGTIPMHGRMIHGRDHGKLWEAAQAYDVHGRVRLPCIYIRKVSQGLTRKTGNQCSGPGNTEQRSSR